MSTNTQSWAPNVIVFVYRNALKVDLGWMEKLGRTDGSRLMPVVLTVEEVHEVLGCTHPGLR